MSSISKFLLAASILCLSTPALTAELEYKGRLLDTNNSGAPVDNETLRLFVQIRGLNQNTSNTCVLYQNFYSATTNSDGNFRVTIANATASGGTVFTSNLSSVLSGAPGPLTCYLTVPDGAFPSGLVQIPPSASEAFAPAPANPGLRTLNVYVFDSTTSTFEEIDQQELTPVYEAENALRLSGRIVGPGPDNIVSLNASGELPAVSGANLTNLNAGNLSGSAPVGSIPDLDASKINTGTFGVARIPNLQNLNGTISFGQLGAYSAIPNTSVVAGSYGSANYIPTFTVGSDGRLTGAGSFALSYPAALMSLNSLTGTVQTLAIGTTGNLPTWSSVGTTHTLNIPMASAVGVTAGLLGKADYDAFSTASALASSGTGTVLQVVSGTGLTMGTITSVGTVSLADTAVTVGGYGNAAYSTTLIVDQQGRLTAAGSVAIAINGNQVTGGTLNLAQVPALDAAQIAAGTLANARLPLSGASAGSVGSSTFVPTLSIDAFGRITSYGSAAVAFPAALSSINGLTASEQIFVVGSAGTMAAFSSAGSTNTLNIPMASGVGVAAGLLSKDDYDAFASGAALAANGTIPVARGGTGIDASSAANGRLLIGNGAGFTLSTLTAGSNITITNSAGEITIASSSSGGSVTQVNTGAGIVGGPFSTVGTISLDASGVTADSYGSASQIPTLTIDQYGRVTAAGSTAVAINADQVTGGTLAFARLPVSGVTAGSFSSTSYIPSFTVDSFGRLVAVGSNAISFPALQWSNVALGVNYALGSVGIGQASPVTLLDVAGAIRIANDATACAAGLAGAIRYNSGFVEFCNGSGPGWQTLGISGAGLQSLNGLTGNQQIFAVGSTGTLSAFVSAGTLHTLNIPNASSAGVVGGLLSNAEYLSLLNGTISVSRGGTGLNAATASAGEILIGNGTGFSLGTLTAGSNININNQNGAITVSSTNSGGTVTQVNTGTGLNGGPFSLVGTISLADTAVTAGAYGNSAYSTTLTVDQQGRLTAAGSTLISINANQITSGTLAFAQLPVSGVVAGSVGSATYIPNLTVDAFGRITSFGSSAVSIPAAISSINGLTAPGQIFVVDTLGTMAAFSSAGSTNTLNIPMANAAGVAGGLLSKIEYDNFVAGASLAANGTIPVARGGTGLDGSAAANGQLLIGNGAGYALGTLTAGSNITITNAAGGITIASSNSGGTVTQVNTGDGLIGGPFSAVGTISLGTTGVIANIYGSGSQIPVLDIDEYGRVVSGTDTPIAINADQVNSGTLAIARLPISGVTAGSFSSSSYIPSFTVDAFGRLISVGSNAISFPALQWSNVALGVNYASGSVGIGQAAPVTKLDVNGAIRVANDGSACAAGLAGAIRYNAGFVEYCNGTGPGWQTLGVSGAGLQALNGLTGNTQVFALGSTGVSPAITSVGTTHTFSIPYASDLGVIGGLVSHADYLTLMNGTIPSARVGDLDASRITSGTLSLARIGVVGNAAGGTGLNTSGASAGQLLIGNGSGFSLGTLFAGSNISILNENGTITISSVNAGGTVTQVNSGTGLTGGPFTQVGTLSLTNTGVAQGSYGQANYTTTFTVDQQGRLTSAGSTLVSIDAGQISAGTLAFTRLPVSGVTSGSVGSSGFYPTLSVDQYGRVTGLGSMSISFPSAVTVLNGLSVGTQGFAVSTTGTFAAFTSAGTLHTLNIPFAADGPLVVGGLVRGTEFASFINRLYQLETGTLAVGQRLAPEFGGTGLNASAAAAGNILIGNGTGFSMGTIGAGSGISVLNQNGSITISATNAGSVTQVNTGAGLVGGPINGVGTISLGTTGVVAGSVGASGFIPQIVFDAFGRITSVGSVAVSVNASAISGTLGVDKGGTGLNSSLAGNGALLIGNGSGFTIGTIVSSNGASVSVGAGSIGISTNASVAANGNTILMRDGSGNTTSAQATATSLRLDNGGAFVSLTNPIGANYSMILPANIGAPGQVLRTNGTSQLSWVTAPLNDSSTRFLGTLGSAITPTFSFFDDSDTGIYSLGDGTMAFTSNGTNRLNITSDGNIGIGTNSPSPDRLAVISESLTGNSVVSGLLLGHYDSNTGGVSGIGNSIRFNTESATNGTTVDTAQIVSVLDDATNASKDGSLRFLTLGPNATAGNNLATEKLRIDSDGNVGIGTTAVRTGNRIEVTGGAIAAANGGELRMMENLSQGTNFVAFRARDTLASDLIWLLPDSLGTAGNVMTVGTGGTLYWSSPSAGVTYPLLSTTRGSVGTPVFSFSDDSDTGIFSPGPGTFAIATNGQSRFGVSEQVVGILGTLEVSETTSSTTGENYLSRLRYNVSPAGSTGNFEAVTVTMSSSASGANSGAMRGIGIGASYSNSGSLVELNGLQSYTEKPGSGSISVLNGIRSIVDVGNFGLVNDAYGLRTNFSSGTAVVNGYGLFIGNVEGLTSKYSIYADDSTAGSYFAGSVAIGVATPSNGAKLQVNGGAIVAGDGGAIRMMENLGSGANFVSLRAPSSLTADQSFVLPYNGGTVGWSLGLTSTGSLGFLNIPGNGSTFLAASGSFGAPGFAFNTDADTGLFSPGTNTLAISTAGTTRLVFTSDGNVGISNQDPLFGGALFSGPVRTLSISGDATASADSYGRIVMANNKATAAANDRLGELTFLSSNNSSAGYKNAGGFEVRLEGAGGANGFGSFMSIFTKPNNALRTEAIRIASTGNVGIGTNAISTGNRLEVTGGAIAVGNGGEIRMMEQLSEGTNYSGFKSFGTLASNLVWTLPAQLGTSNQVLTVGTGGTLYWSAPSGAVSYPLLSTTLGSVGSPVFSFSADSDTGIFSPGPGTFAVSANGQTGLVVNTLGVGIGVANPQSKMDVYDSRTGPVSGSIYATRTLFDLNPSAVISGQMEASDNHLRFMGSSNATGQLRGVAAVLEHSSGGTVTEGSGIEGYLFRTGTGSFGDGAAVRGSVVNNSAGAMGTVAAFNGSVIQSAGNITNGYGLYLGDIQATNRRAIYSTDNLASSYFAGSVGIGISSPVEALEVLGGIKVGNTTTTNPGTIRYNAGTFEGRNGSTWVPLASSGSGPVVLEVTRAMSPFVYNKPGGASLIEVECWGGGGAGFGGSGAGGAGGGGGAYFNLRLRPSQIGASATVTVGAGGVGGVGAGAAGTASSFGPLLHIGSVNMVAGGGGLASSNLSAGAGGLVSPIANTDYQGGGGSNSGGTTLNTFWSAGGGGSSNGGALTSTGGLSANGGSGGNGSLGTPGQAGSIPGGGGGGSQTSTGGSGADGLCRIVTHF